MKKRKLKKTPLIIGISILVVLIAIVVIIFYTKHINSTSYKLEQLGYTQEEVTTILKLDDEEVTTILEKEYNISIPSLLKEKYFLFKNLDTYLKYHQEKPKLKLNEVVSIINVKANYDHYEETEKTNLNINDSNLILVNKYNYLSSEYIPNNIIDIPLTYAYSDNQATEEVYNAFKNMAQAAKKEDLTLIINSSYRDYGTQEKVWNSYSNQLGDEYADSVAARAGHSEHQTGLALDIVTYGSTKSNFEETDEFTWLQKNAHKYGFILRYPKDKEDITGYSYESWHYRYVGVDIATKIYKEKITFDEYYAYYIQ